MRFCDKVENQSCASLRHADRNAAISRLEHYIVHHSSSPFAPCSSIKTLSPPGHPPLFYSITPHRPLSASTSQAPPARRLIVPSTYLVNIELFQILLSYKPLTPSPNFHNAFFTLLFQRLHHLNPLHTRPGTDPANLCQATVR